MKQPPIEVFLALSGQDVTVGTYFPHPRGAGTFAYSQEWIAHPEAYPLTPHLDLREGNQPLTMGPGALPVAFSDSAPDRWGRKVIRKQFASRGEQPLPTDYLLSVADKFRMGALRYRVNGEVQAPLSRVPKVIELDALERAAREVDADEDTADVLERLVVAGSSLGGARPKATVVDDRGHTMMAKFAAADDKDIDVSAWEKVCLDIARLSQITTPEATLKSINGRNVLLMERFDREYDVDGNETRVPYMSAMTMLDAADNDDDFTMVEVAEAFRVEGGSSADLAEMFSRTALNLLVGNTDNHLRNHGFLYKHGVWQLSPLFDVTPATTKTDFALPVAPGEPDTIDTLLGNAEWFALDQKEARTRLATVASAVRQWQALARKNGIPPSQDVYVQPGFEGEHLARALALTHDVETLEVEDRDTTEGLPRCSRCGRVLRTPEAIARGMGSTCASKQ